MNIKRLHKLAEELRNENFFIHKQGDYHNIFYKKVILVHVPEDEQLAEHIAREYGALSVRIASELEALIERMEASAKQELLNLNFSGGTNVNERPSGIPDSGHRPGEAIRGTSEGDEQGGC
jgi:hypothetical protein